MLTKCPVEQNAIPVRIFMRRKISVCDELYNEKDGKCVCSILALDGVCTQKCGDRQHPVDSNGDIASKSMQVCQYNPGFVANSDNICACEGSLNLNLKKRQLRLTVW